MIDLSKLTSDGDTVDLPDGRALRLRMEPDDINPFEEYDTYGRMQWERNHRDNGWSIRPDGFTGNAEKVSTDSGASLWWEPPTDGPARGSEEFRAFRAQVMELLEYGMVYVSLEMLDSEEDAYGRRIVRNVASVGGVEPMPTADYLHELVSQLFEEMEAEA